MPNTFQFEAKDRPVSVRIHDHLVSVAFADVDLQVIPGGTQNLSLERVSQTARFVHYRAIWRVLWPPGVIIRAGVETTSGSVAAERLSKLTIEK